MQKTKCGLAPLSLAVAIGKLSRLSARLQLLPKINGTSLVYISI